MQWKSYKIIFLVELIVLVNNQWYVNFGYVTFERKKRNYDNDNWSIFSVVWEYVLPCTIIQTMFDWGFSLLRFPRSSSFMFCGFTFFLTMFDIFFFILFNIQHLAFLNNMKTNYTTAAMSGQNGNVEFDRSRWANKRSQHALHYLY